MKVFGLNMLLAVTWVAFSGSVSLSNLVVGFVLGYGVIWVIQPMLGESAYARRGWVWVKLALYFIWDLVTSSVDVAVDVLTPRHRSRPAILELPLDVKTDVGILLVTNLISLTPGTLSLEVSADRRTLRFHAMFADEPERLKAGLKRGIERLVIDAVER